MNLQRISVKLFTDATGDVDVDPFLRVFSRWRQDRQESANWVDLADYAHVPKGPGVLLIGKQGNLSIDLADPGPGIAWANKKDLEGGEAERIVEVFRRAVRLATALVAEPEYPDSLAPRPGFWQLIFNDRLEAPNDDATDRLLRPSVESAVRRLFGDGATMIRDTDAGRRYGFVIHTDASLTLKDVSVRAQLAPSGKDI